MNAHADRCVDPTPTPATVAARRLAAEVREALTADGLGTLTVEPHTNADGRPYATVIDPPPHDLTALRTSALTCSTALTVDTSHPGRVTVWSTPPLCDWVTVAGSDVVDWCEAPATAVITGSDDVDHLGCPAHTADLAALVLAHTVTDTRKD